MTTTNKHECKMKIGLWGLGDRAKRYLEFGYFNKDEIVFFVDRNKHGMTFIDKPVISPKEFISQKDQIDYLIVTTKFYKEVLAFCINNKLFNDRIGIIFTDYIDEQFYEMDTEIVRQHFPKLYNDIMMRQVSLTYKNEKDETDSKRLIGRMGFEIPDYTNDYFRYRTFEFIAETILENDIDGDVAELGVYRGVFSALINAKFPNKELHLFDTFEGFDSKEARKEENLGRADAEFEFAHLNTSEDMVINRMPNKEKCHVYKGMFPGTVTEDLRRSSFSFVSIDVDFEDSIYEGVKFFYPRLNSGGYIFLHDYNSANLKGVKNAICRYEKEINQKIIKVPIADRAGTLVIAK